MRQFSRILLSAFAGTLFAFVLQSALSLLPHSALHANMIGSAGTLASILAAIFFYDALGRRETRE
jgi:hypothetical protein